MLSLCRPARGPALPAGTREMITDFEVGVLLPSAVESSGTSGLVSG